MRHALWSLLLLTSFSVVSWPQTTAAADAVSTAGSAQGMVTAFEKFRAKLTDEQWKECSFPFDDAERLNWHFIPRARKGLPIADLEGQALRAAKQFLQSGLTEAGYDQALKVISMEEVLYLIEKGDEDRRRRRRHTGEYYISVFGQPGATGKWGWRVEGHHLALNFTIEDGQVVSSTPEFFGINPSVLDAGNGRELRVLGPEEELARQIVKACDEGQRGKVLISAEALPDVPGANVPQPSVPEVIGLSYADMSEKQQQLLQQLLSEYFTNVSKEIGEARWKAARDAGLDKITLAWWGGMEPNQPHHYRVQGPTFLIEYNNTQDGANHIHALLRCPTGDFALPIR